MYLKKSNPASKNSLQKSFKTKRTIWLWVLGLLALFLLFTGFVFYQGLHWGGVLSREYRANHPMAFFTEVIPRKLKIDFNSTFGATAKLEKLNLDIGHIEQQKLAFKRDQALEKGYLLRSDEDFVSAKINLNGNSYPVKIRLKGDFLDHLRKDKTSYRVKVKGENTVMGMKYFSLQHPGTRAYLNEWFFHECARKMGLIALRYRFVSLSINGQEHGIYAMEESFAKHLLEFNQRAEGVILKFNGDDYIWEMDSRFAARPPGASDYYVFPFDAFQSDEMLADSVFNLQFRAGISLLEGFREGRLAASEVFHVERFAKLIALCELLGAEHALTLGQYRFYLDPRTAKLEPIPYDGDAGQKTRQLAPFITLDREPYWRGDNNRFFLERLFRDTAFMGAYLQELETLSAPGYLEGLLASVEDTLMSQSKVLLEEFPNANFSSHNLYLNRDYIRYCLHPKMGLHAYLKNQNENSITLELGGIQGLPVAATGISYKDSLFHFFKHPIYIPPRPLHQPVQYHQIKFDLPKSFSNVNDLTQNLEVSYQTWRTQSEPRSIKVFPYPHADSTLAWPTQLKGSDLSKFDFLSVDEERKTIQFSSGYYFISETIIFSKGHTVFIPAHARITLKNSASLISFSPIHFLGEEESSISINGHTGSGIFIYHPGKKSVWRHANFNGLSGPKHLGWNFSGAVTILESDIEMRGCFFDNSRSEDALHLIRSTCNLKQCHFRSNTSDAFDGDFIEGKMDSVSFNSSGNDALDLSGSKVRISNALFWRTGDKGISAGENSQVTGFNIGIVSAKIGIAAKDLSEVKIEGANIGRCQTALAAFQKKPEFGPGTIEVKSGKFPSNDILYRAEKNSRITVNGTIIPDTATNLKQKLYDVPERP